MSTEYPFEVGERVVVGNGKRAHRISKVSPLPTVAYGLCSGFGLLGASRMRPADGEPDCQRCAKEWACEVTYDDA